MHLLLVRHGQSANNVLEAAHGAGDAFNASRSVDPPLSELGECQAQLLGRHLGAQLRRSRHRARLICSSMTRACQTIEPLARTLGLAPLVHPDVYEVKGFYDTSGENARGPGRAAIHRRFAGYDVSLIPEEGQGAERCRDAEARAKRVIALLREWAAADPTNEGVVVLVSHNDFIVLLAKLLLVPSSHSAVPRGDEPEELFTDSYWPMNNTGVSHFVLGVRPPPGAYQVGTYLLYYNRSDHLSEATRSGVQFKNMGFGQAAEWARVGEGGSRLWPLFVERETLNGCAARPAWALAAGLGLLSLVLLSRR